MKDLSIDLINRLSNFVVWMLDIIVHLLLSLVGITKNIIDLLSSLLHFINLKLCWLASLSFAKDWDIIKRKYSDDEIDEAINKINDVK